MQLSTNDCLSPRVHSARQGYPWQAQTVSSRASQVVYGSSCAEAIAGVAGAGTAGSKKRKAVDWFASAAGLQAAAGRAASEYQRDAEKHLGEALALQPGAVEIALALIQVCCEDMLEERNLMTVPVLVKGCC